MIFVLEHVSRALQIATTNTLFQFTVVSRGLLFFCMKSATFTIGVGTYRYCFGMSDRAGYFDALPGAIAGGIFSCLRVALEQS